ncbi:nickel/cobalt transporter [Alphaproteobacteria bacterium]|jgi:ABC-type nickel/cobalt efflux system permease component RcnA|nr:nickel/cobalt transporter [Alphaproteobacteria bacterium]
MKYSGPVGIIVIFAFAVALIGIALLLLLSEAPHLFGEWGAFVYGLQTLQRDLHSSLADAVRAVERDGLMAAWSLIGLSFIYGVFHAAGPGHGKLIIATYLATHVSRLKQGIWLAISSALAQGVVAVFVVEATVALLGSSLSSVNTTALQLESVSYALVVLLGGFLMVTAARRLWLGHHHHHDQHPEEGAHAHHGHAHMPAPDDLPERMSLRQTIWIVLTIGIRPCTGAILVLIFAYVLQLRFAGICAVFAMSIGTAITVAVLAGVSVYARQMAVRLSEYLPDGGVREGTLLNTFALFGGLIVLLLGIALFQSVQAAIGHPIL